MILKKIINSSTRFIFLLFLLIVLILLFFFLNVMSKNSFPRLEPGIYIGKFNFKNVSEQFLLKVSSSEKYNLFFFDKEFRKRKLSGHFVKESFPLVLAGSSDDYFLTGTIGKNKFSGEVKKSNTEVGKWKMRKVKKINSELNDQIAAKIPFFTEIYKIEQELQDLGQKKFEFSNQKKMYKSEIKDAKNIRTHVDQEIGVVINEIERLEKEALVERKETEKLWKKVELSQKVTPTGILVSLARDISNLESKWMNSIFSSTLAGIPSISEEDYKKGLEIVKLKEQIVELEHKSYRLSEIRSRYEN